MGKLITCAAAVEPSAFTAAGQSAVFATLNFAVTDGTEANAMAAFESFAADVANARFYLYQATVQPDGSFVLDLDATSAQPLAAIGAAPGTLATDIVAWIKTRATASAALKWVFDPREHLARLIITMSRQPTCSTPSSGGTRHFRSKPDFAAFSRYQRVIRHRAI
jgi:hypothetical protein